MVVFDVLRRMMLVAGAAALLGAAPVAAQIRTVDPSSPSVSRNAAAARQTPPADDAPVPLVTAPEAMPEPEPATAAPPAPSSRPAPSSAPQSGVDRAIASEANKPDPTNIYQDDDILGAAEGVFGRGAEGLAKVIEDVLKKQGRPNAYIGGREVGGAFVVGLRYGSGTLHHKIEGDRPIYWTGPSLGLDFGGNGAKTFVLVYNLYDSQNIYDRFPAVEGAAYVVGGFNVSYMRRGDIVLIPIRLGVGWRLGANVGYMKFSEKGKILPF